MTSTVSRPAIEIAAEWIAAVCLGGAVAFAAARIAQGGAALAIASVAGLVAASLALLILRAVDRVGFDASADFAPVDYPVVEQAAEADELLLDDPLPAIDAESRVVRLFAADPPRTATATTLPDPGEMVARIEDFLGMTRDGTAPPSARDGAAASADASAALHAALADIRRSLRHGRASR